MSGSTEAHAQGELILFVQKSHLLYLVGTYMLLALPQCPSYFLDTCSSHSQPRTSCPFSIKNPLLLYLIHVAETFTGDKKMWCVIMKTAAALDAWAKVSEWTALRPPARSPPLRPFSSSLQLMHVSTHRCPLIPSKRNEVQRACILCFCIWCESVNNHSGTSRVHSKALFVILIVISS